MFVALLFPIILVLAVFFYIFFTTKINEKFGTIANKRFLRMTSLDFSSLDSDSSFNFLRRFYPLIFAAISLFWIFWLNLDGGFPYLGFTIFGIFLTIFTIWQLGINIKTLLFGTICVFFSLTFATYSPQFLLSFFNFSAFLYSFSFLILTKSDFQYTLPKVFFAPLYLLASLLNLPKNLFPFSKTWFSASFYKELFKKPSENSQNSQNSQTNSQNNSNISSSKSTPNLQTNSKENSQDSWQKKPKEVSKNREIFIGTSITLLVIIIIVPLLAASNPFFANLLSSFWSVFGNSIIWILEFIYNFLSNFFAIFSLWSLFLLFIFCTFLPRISSLIYFYKLENFVDFENYQSQSIANQNNQTAQNSAILISTNLANSTTNSTTNSQTNSTNLVQKSQIETLETEKMENQNLESENLGNSKVEVRNLEAGNSKLENSDKKTNTGLQNSELIKKIEIDKTNIGKAKNEEFGSRFEKESKNQTEKVEINPNQNLNKIENLEPKKPKNGQNSKDFKEVSKNENKNPNLTWLIPKFSTVLVLFVFIISQFFLYFAPNLLDINYNYGQLNNEVFAQLSLVCFVVFGLIYFANSFQFWQRILSFILLFEASFLGFVGFKSVFDYISNFALTFKRLYGLSVVFLVFGFVLIFAIQNFAKLSKSWLLKRSILLVFLTLILINFANFDALIYYNMPKETNKTDWKYMSELSLDSGNLDKILDKYVKLQREYLQSPNKNKYEGFSPKELPNQFPDQPKTPQIQSQQIETLQIQQLQNQQNNDNLKIPTAPIISPPSMNSSTSSSMYQRINTPNDVDRYFEKLEDCQAFFDDCRYNHEFLHTKDSFYSPLYVTIQKVDYLHSKYDQNYINPPKSSNSPTEKSKFLIQSFNLTEFQTFQKVKNIDLDKLQKEFYF